MFAASSSQFVSINCKQRIPQWALDSELLTPANEVAPSSLFARVGRSRLGGNVTFDPEVP